MSYRYYALLGLAAVMAVAPGCATKKFVRQTVDPVNQHVGELDKRTADNAKAIESLDDKTQRDISRMGEQVGQRADRAQTRADEAYKQAQDGIARASQADTKASNAQTAADNSMAKASQVERVVDNLDNYQVAGSKTVYFNFNQSALQDDAKAELAEIAQTASRLKRFVIEVQGFTDTTGPAEYNYELSQKRADVVVRHLTTEHKIPSYRIHTLALGKDAPVENPDRREARRLSRRVEVKVYTPSDITTTAGAR
jgi:outer membrane protein OmpA-like peptidoglycan-associated protein